MKKKDVIFIIAMVILTVVGLTFAKVLSDLKKENTIKSEVKEIVKVLQTNNIDDDNVNSIIERRNFSKGDYYTLENSLKNYYKDLYSELKNITFLLEIENYNYYLTSKNIEEDGPEFTKSKGNLQNAKAQLQEHYDKFKKLLTDDETVKSYIANESVKAYYKSLYTEIVKDYTPANLESEMEAKFNAVNNLIDINIKALDFLSANASHWQLRNGVITFDDTKLFEDYKEITTGLNNKEEKLD